MPCPKRRPVPWLLLIFCALPCLCLHLGNARAATPLAADLVQDNQPINFRQQKFTDFFVELQDRHHFSGAQLRAIFSGLTIDRRVLVLMDRQGEAKPYYEYAPMFITNAIIQTGRAKLEEQRRVLDQIERRLGVNREVLVAIWGIETRYGTNQGSYDVLRTLTTLFDAYPRRAQFFRQELIHFLLLCRETGMDPRQIKGSYAGAFGQTQFMPSSFRKYALSFDADHKRDVWNSSADVLASIANYLKHFGWVLDAPVYAELGTRLNSPQLLATEQKGRRGRIAASDVARAQQRRLPPVPGGKGLSIVGLELPPGSGAEKRYVAGYPNFHAITEWNHSNRYAMAVSELAEALAQ